MTERKRMKEVSNMEYQQTTFIYTLDCPISGVPRYVGKANNPHSRFLKHIREARYNQSTHRKVWINYLYKQGLIPVLTIIDEVQMEEWEFWEKHYISLYKSWGFDLVNRTVGGFGITHWTPELRHKMSIIKTNMSSEIKKKISQSRMGVLVSDEWRKNISKGVYLHPPHPRPVSMIDKETGSIIMSFPTISGASRETGILLSSIANCLGGRTKTSGGYAWNYTQQNA